MITNEHKQVVSARVAGIVAVHQLLIPREVVHMALAMEMDMPQTWVPYRHPHRAYSIQHQVSLLYFYFQINRFA